MVIAEGVVVSGTVDCTGVTEAGTEVDSAMSDAV